MSIFKRSFLCLLCFVLMGCSGLHDRFPVSKTSKQDWSTFVYPPAGTPCTLAVYHYQNGKPIKVMIPGAWGDSNPWVIRFPIWERMEKVCIVQIIHEGEIIVTVVFKPPVMFEKGVKFGYRKHLKGIR